MSYGRANSLTKHLKGHDSSLYAACEAHSVFPSTSVIYVLRKNPAKPHEPFFIFALTDDWTAKSRPREWGIEVVLNRIVAMDLWKNETVMDRLFRDYEKREASEKRARRNDIEDFLYDFRKDFAKATNGINTSLLPKTDLRRTGDLKYGS